MWGNEMTFPRGRLSLRYILLLAASLIAVFFANVIASTAAQAIDATRAGDSIIYDSRTFTPVTPGAPLPPDVPAGSYGYQDAAGNQAGFLIFPAGTAPGSATSAEYVTYGFTPPGTYTARTATQTVALPATAAAAGPGAPAAQPAADGDIVPECSGNSVGSVGWILCPLSSWLASAVDELYDLISMFLNVAPITNSSPIHQLWSVMRGLANVCFVIAFLVIIYSQITNMGVSNLGIKSTLPRLIVAAVLVNVSFWICALAVDLSNYLGYALNNILIGIRENIAMDIDVSWVQATGYVLSAGGIGFLWFTSATAGSFASAGFLLVSLLLGVALAALVAFIILAARQALLIVFIAISPLAFVAYLLPNTEKWFDRWKDAFMTLLLMFPVFSLLFGGAQLAGTAIIASAGDNFPLVLMGMATQIAPLAVTPFLIKFSGGVLSTIANMTNDKKRGLFDRANNWAQSRADYHKDKSLGKDFGKLGKINPFNASKFAARGLNRGNIVREQRRKGYQQMAQNAAMGTKGYHKADDMVRTAEVNQRNIESGHDMQWKSKFDVNNDDKFDQKLFQKEMSTRANTRSSKTLDSRLDKVETEMSAGHKHFIGPASADFQSIVDQMQRATEEHAYTDMASKIAERAVNQNVAQNLTDASKGMNATLIDNKRLHEYAGGVLGATGQTSVLASAKSTASRYLMDDIEHKFNTMDYDVATNNDKLHQAFFDSSATMADRLAYSQRLAKNGAPGIKKLQEVFEQYEQLPSTSTEDLMTYQEILASNSSIMSSGKNIELWLTRSQKYDTNGVPQFNIDGTPVARTFRDLSQDISTFTNLSPSAFASQNAAIQTHALELINNSGTKQQYLSTVNMLRNNQNALNSIKQKVREKFSIYSDAEIEAARIAGNPLPPPGTII